MDLVAGETRDILLALAVDDIVGLDDPERFTSHLAFGGGLGPTWLDLFSEAVRSVTGDEEPENFLGARRELDGTADAGERTAGRVDRGWGPAAARGAGHAGGAGAPAAGVADHEVGAGAGRWIDLLEEEMGELAREEKPWIRDLTARIVEFARRAEPASDVIFAWSM